MKGEALDITGGDSTVPEALATTGTDGSPAVG